MGATSLVKVGTAAGAGLAFTLMPLTIAADATAKVTTTGATRCISPPSKRPRRERCPSLAYFGGAGTQDDATIDSDVMLTRLTGDALINSPLTMTVWPLWAGKLNSDTPMSRY